MAQPRTKDRHRLKSAVTVRVPTALKAQWAAAAMRRGMTLSAWVVAACDESLRRDDASSDVPK